MARFDRVGWVGVVALWLAACGGAGDGGTQAKTGGAALVAATAAVAEPPRAPAWPDAVPDLTTLVPKEATAVVGLPGLDAITVGMDRALLGTLRARAIEEIAGNFGLSSELAARAIGAYGGAVVFVDRDPGKSPKGAAIVRIKDPSVVEPLARAAKLTSSAVGRWSSESLHVAWLDRAGVLLVANDPGALDRTLALAAGEGENFTRSALRGPDLQGPVRPDDLWLAVDLDAASLGALPGSMEPGSRLVGVMDFATGIELDYRQLGDKVPRMGAVLAPSPQEALASLPAGAVFGWGVSIKRNKALRDVLSEIGRPDGKDLAPIADGLLSAAGGISLADLDRGLGDEIAMGVYPSGDKLMDASGFAKTGAILVTVATRDDAVAAKVIDALAKAMRGEKGLKASPGKLSLVKDGVAVDVSVQKGSVLIVAGAAQPALKLRARALASKDPLGRSAPFESARTTAPALSHTLLYADFEAIFRMLPIEATASLGGLRTGSAVFALTLKPSDSGLDLHFRGSGGLGVVSGLGTMSALGIYGVRRYIQASNSSEAKNTIGAIARGAAAGYEREKINGDHALCGSAPPVPAVVPSGTKYQPQTDPGRDFQTGSLDLGWKCLRFSITQPHYYQYEYRVGGGYKGPKRGGPDPGKDGFEVSAEGDLDGDGKTSLFTLTGTVTPLGVKVSPQIFSADEFE